MSVAGVNDRETERLKNVRVLLEAVTLVLLLAPVLWMLLHWREVPARPSHLRGTRWSLFVMPGLATAAYVFLSEFGLFAHMDLWRKRERPAGLRPMFLAFLLTLRMELIAFFAVLSFGMLRAAMTGLWWSARGITAVTLTSVGVTLVAFLAQMTRKVFTVRAHAEMKR